MSKWQETQQPIQRRERVLTVGSEPNTAYARIVYDEADACLHINCSRCVLHIGDETDAVLEQIDEAVEQLNTLRRAVLVAALVKGRG